MERKRLCEYPPFFVSITHTKTLIRDFSSFFLYGLIGLVFDGHSAFFFFCCYIILLLKRDDNTGFGKQEKDNSFYFICVSLYVFLTLDHDTWHVGGWAKKNTKGWEVWGA